MPLNENAVDNNAVNENATESNAMDENLFEDFDGNLTKTPVKRHGMQQSESDSPLEDD